MAVGIEDSGEIVRQVIAVLAVFGLLAFAVSKLRAREGFSKPSPSGGWSNWAEFFQGPIVKTKAGVGKAAESRQLISVERLKLTQQHTLHLVRAGKRDVLIVTHAQGCSLVLDGVGEDASSLDQLASPSITKQVSA
jgi:hypothetical protein